MVITNRNDHSPPPTMISYKCYLKNNRGFTLLEVMIAIAILSITLTALFGSQSRSLSLAAEAKFYSTAALLGQEKLAEYQAGMLEYVNDEGDFGENYPGFSWEVEVQEADLSSFELETDDDSPLYRVDLKISWEAEFFVATFTHYGRSLQ